MTATMTRMGMRNRRKVGNFFGVDPSTTVGMTGEAGGMTGDVGGMTIEGVGLMGDTGEDAGGMNPAPTGASDVGGRIFSDIV